MYKTWESLGEFLTGCFLNWRKESEGIQYVRFVRLSILEVSLEVLT